MVMNRKRKENTGNGVSSFADLEDQHRQEAQRQVQSVSRGSRKQADQTMGNIIEQQNQEARQQVQQTNNVYKDADKYIDATAEYAKEGFADLPENLTRTVDKRGSGKVGDDLLSEIASGHSLEALEQAQRAEQSGDLAINAGKQYTRGLISAGTGIYDAAEGYTRVEEALMSPEAQYQAYVLANQGINPANTEGFGTVEEGNKYFNDLIQGYQNSELRAGLNEAYNSLENELSDTMVGQALESAGRQTPRGLMTAALGTAGAGALSKPALDALQKTASLGIMGAEVAGQDMYRTLTDGEHDYTAQQALAHGLASAGGEILTENLDKIPIIKDIPILVNSSVTGQAMGLKDLIGEGYEEYVNQRLDPFINMTLQDNSNGQWAGNAWNALKEAYSAENTAQALKAGAEGALSAAFTSGITNPTQTVSQWQEDIQNLQNLPSDLTRAATQTVNQIRGTNEYEKALKKSLVSQRESELEMMPEGQDKERVRQEIQADKENIRKQYIGENGENLVSEDALVREAAQAANRDNILEQARKAGVDQKQAEVTATLANRAGRVLEIRDRESFVNEFGKNNGLYDTNTGRIVLSAGTKDPFLKVATHEITHSLEGTQEFDSFMRFLSDAVQNGSLTTDYGSYEHLQDLIKETYADQMATMTPAQQEELLNSETTAFLSQELMGNEDVINSLVANNRSLAQTIYDGLRAFTARVTNNRTELDALDTQRSIRRATELFEKAMDRDAEISRQAQQYADRQFSRDLDSEDSVENKIRNSMSMKEARRMLEKTWNQYKDYYDAKTLDEFIKDDPDYAVSQFAELIENTYGLQNEYINSNDDILNEEYMIEDVIQAYVDGNLKDESKSYKLKDTQYKEGVKQSESFFTPKTIKDAQKLYQVASQRVTKANEAEVYRARADLIVFAHNADAESTLGLTRSELNKKIRSWSRYSAQARQISERLNAGVPEQYRWSGLENSNNINQWLLANDTNIKNEISELVKEVKGDYDDNATRNIIDVMLALDSHINYKDLTIDFAYGKKIGQNGRANGTYDHLDTTITISSGARHTVAHETGHFIDNLWGREISEFMNEARNMYLSDLSLSNDFRTGNEDLDAFISNFRTFIDKLAAKNDIRNEYTQTRTEIFARFCDYFVGWVNKTAGGYEYGGGYYNDNFTPADCTDFVKLLQQKSMLNATVLAESTTGEQNLKFSKDLDSEYREDGTRKDLIAAHNLTQDKLRKVKDLGGSVMPSIAVTKDTIPHKGYGNITIVMDKKSVDPARRDNKAYKRDAWTPRFPEVNYRATFDSLYDLNEELSSIPYFEELTKSSVNSDMYRLKDADNFQNLLESNNGDPVKAFENNDAMKALYLLDKGQISSLPVREKEITREFHNTDAKEIARKIGTWNIEQIDKASVEEARQYLGDVLKTINKHFSDKLGYEGDLYNEANFGVYDLKDFARAINSYIEDNTKFQEVDRSKLSTVAVEADDVDYRNWLKDKFKSLKIESGIRNNKDPFTPSGKRRSFKELHDPLTAERALKHMKAQDPAGSDTFFSPTFNAIIGVYNGEYRNLNDFIKNEGILAPDSDDKSSLYYQLEQEYTDSINTLASEAFDNSTSKYKQYYSYQGLVADAVADFAKSKNHTPENLKRILKSDGNVVSDEAAQAMVDVLERTKDITTDYYEVKAQRIVRPDEEWKQAYYPTGTDADLVQWMQDQGMETYEYDPKVNDARWTKINENAGKYKFSRDLLDDNNLAEVNPFLVSEGASFVDRRLTASERQIDRSKIPASVLDKAYTYDGFGKKFEKKNKTVSDMAWLGRKLQEAQEEVNRENAEYRGREAFGGAYGEVIRRLKEAGIKEPREVINQYLDRITWKGTAEADAAIENDPNASIIMSAIKTNLNPKFIQNLQDAHFASQRKAQKTRDESKVKGTEAYYRKSLEKGRSYVKERTGELLKGLGADIDLRMSPMQASTYFGGGEIHSPIGDARAALRASGITKTSEYSDWLKLYFLESLEGYKHNDEMLSRLKDKILSDEQLATDSDMANGGFEYMLEQLDNAAKRYLRLKTEMEDPDYNNDRYMSDLYQVGTVVPLTENDHMSTATRDLRLAGALGTTANDPRLAQVAEKVESILRERSADESETFRSYGSFDPNDKFGMNNPYMDRIYKETGIRDEWIINEIYHDMKLAHGRNNGFNYVPAPTQAEINLATAKRRAESAAKTREFFNNRDSLNEAVEEASANETPEETIPVEDIPVNEEQVNTSAYGAENYMFPGDLDDPRRFQQFDFDSDDINPNNNTGLNEPFSYEDFYQRIYEGDDYQTQPDDYQLPTDADAPEYEERIVPTDEYTPEFADQKTETEFKEATEGVDKGYYIKLEDYMPGKLFSEMTEDEIRETKKKALQKKEYIDTLAWQGMNKGSTGMTLEQNRNQIADGNKDVDEALYELFEKPMADAKDLMFEHWAKMAEKLDYVVNKLGIKERSKESKGMQWYMERTQDTRYAPRGSYTLENLKRDFPDKWKDIKKGAEILEEMYDEYYTKINESLEMNYPEKVLIEEEKKLRDMLDDQIAEKQALLEKLLQDPRRNAGQIQKLRGQLAKIAKRYNDITHEVRVNKRLPLRADYAHHYLDTKMTLSNFIQAFKDVYNNRAHNNISNKLAPISQDTKPLTRWWGAMQRRKRGDYTRDAIGGMLRYWDRAEQKIFIDPYSGYLRGVVSELARSADEAETDQSSMIRYYSAYINSLTGKTNPYDRALTYAFNGRGRQVVSLLKTLNGRIKSNAVMGNFNSMIAQVYNLPNAVAILKEHGGAKSAQDWKAGLGRFMQDKFAPDKECDASTFLTERYWNNVIDPLRDISTPAKFASSMMEFGDRLVAEMTWYAAKAQGERLGVGNTVRYADEMTRRAVAGRGIGEVPISQQAEITKLFAPFQVEVNNAYQLMKHLAGEKQAGALMAMFLTAFFMNLIKKKVTKTDGTGFDPIGAIVDAFKEKGQWRDLLDSEEWDDIAKDASGNLLGDFISNLPYGSLIAEFAGLSSNGYGNSYFGERDPTRYGIGNIGIAGLTEPVMTALFDSPENVDWTKLITNYGLPYGGKQAERTIKTMQDLGWIPHFGQGNYSWKEGAYTKNGDLKYVIDTDNPLDVARALMFGTYASEAGQEYLENRRTLGGNGVTVFNTLVDSGVDSSDAYQAMMSLKDVEYPHGLPSNMAAPSVAKRKALEDAGVWDEWTEAYNNMDEEQQDAFRSGTGNIAKGVIAMDDEEFQRAYDAVFGTGEDEAVNVPAETENVPTSVETADTVSSLSPSRQQAYDTVTSADIGVDSDALSQTMSSLETKNLTDADGNKIDNSRSAVNRLSYEEDGSYQAIIDFIESDDNKNSDDPLTYADFGLSKSVVNMSDDELDELLEQINEGTGSTYRRRSGGSSRGNSRRANAFRRSGTSAIRSLGNQHISTYVPKKKGSYTRSTDTIKRLQQKTKSLTNGVMKTDVDLYDSIFNK